MNHLPSMSIIYFFDKKMYILHGSLKVNYVIFQCTQFIIVILGLRILYRSPLFCWNPITLLIIYINSGKLGFQGSNPTGDGIVFITIRHFIARSLSLLPYSCLDMT